MQMNDVHPMHTVERAASVRRVHKQNTLIFQNVSEKQRKIFSYMLIANINNKQKRK